MFFTAFSRRRAQAERAEKALQAVQEVATSWRALVARVSKLETELRDLEEQHSTTVSHLNKLRGQVHGPRGALKSVPNDVGAIPYGDKDALRRHAGIQAGQRFTHPEEKEHE